MISQHVEFLLVGLLIDKAVGSMKDLGLFQGVEVALTAYGDGLLLLLERFNRYSIQTVDRPKALQLLTVTKAVFPPCSRYGNRLIQ